MEGGHLHRLNHMAQRFAGKLMVLDLVPFGQCRCLMNAHCEEAYGWQPEVNDSGEKGQN